MVCSHDVLILHAHNLPKMNKLITFGNKAFEIPCAYMFVLMSIKIKQTVMFTQLEEAQERCKEQEEVKEGETSQAAETSFSSEIKKIPSLTLSLQPGKASLSLVSLSLIRLSLMDLFFSPVVVMEPLKAGGQVNSALNLCYISLYGMQLYLRSVVTFFLWSLIFFEDH